MGTTVSFNRGPRTVDPKAKPSCAPKHRRPFFVYLELECIGFPDAEAEALERLCARSRIPCHNAGLLGAAAGCRREIVFELRGDVAPYACEPVPQKRK